MLGFSSISESPISTLLDELVAGSDSGVDWRNNDSAVAFLRGEGYTGSYNDMLLAYLNDFYGINSPSLNDLLARYIKTEGNGLEQI